MPIDSVANLVEELQRNRLLDAHQLGAVGEQLQPRCADPRTLAKELLQRGWLTSFQINRLFQSRGKELVMGSYVLLEPLGEGGMGQVFKARHVRLERIDALKVIRKQLLANPNSVQRFQREARAAARLSHPNVIAIYDAGEVGDVHFLAMEYVAGTDLGRLIKASGPLPIGQACDYIRQAALGLQHAHERGLIHRDIKPANLLLTADGSTVKLLDLGLARLQGMTSDDANSLTETGAVVGTPDYIAPEQARNSKDVDIRADVYSLGCSLYYLLTGHGPFGGETLTEKLLKHQLDLAQPVNELRADVPPELAAIVAKLMAKKPQDRYQTPAEVAAAMAPFAGHTSAGVMPLLPPAPPVPMALPAMATPETLPGGQTVQLYKVSAGRVRSPLLVGGVLVGLLAVPVLGGAFFWWSARGTSERRQAVPGTTAAVAATSANPPVNAEKARDAIDRGNAAYAAQNYAQSIKEFGEAIRLHPGLAVAWSNRGQAYRMRGEPDRAIADFTEAIRLEPNHETSYFNRAMAYAEKGDLESSLADNSRVITLQKEFAPAYHNRGTNYLHLKRWELAIQDFDSALRYRPGYASAYFGRGGAYLELGRFKAALADLNEAIRLEPNRPGNYYSRGVANYYCGHLDQAIEDLTEAIAQAPRTGKAYFFRSRAHEKKGNQAEADADFKMAIKLDRRLLEFKE